MLTFLAIGGLAFWISIAILTITVVWSLEEDAYGFAGFLTVLFIAAFGYAAIPVISLSAIAWGAGAYIVAGSVWSIWRWYRHVRKMIAMAKAGEKINGYDIAERHIEPSNNKAKIMAWIAYWPWSVVWELTAGLWRNLYDLLVGVYDRISAGAKSELKVLAEAKTAK